MTNYTKGSSHYSKMKFVKPFLRLQTIAVLAFVFFGYEALSQAPTVTLPTVTSVGTTTATLGGTVTGTLTNRGTRWNTSSPVGTSNQLDEVTATQGAFTQNRTGLPAASKIFFVAYGKNGVPENTTSETTFFTEPVQLTAGQVTVDATSSSDITINFPAASSWKGTNATAGYVLFRKIGSAPALGSLVDGTAPPSNGTGDKIATITTEAQTAFIDNSGTGAGTEYYYTIVPFVWDGADNTTYNYNITSPITKSDWTYATEPGGHATGSLTATPNSSTQITLAFNSITTSGITNAVGYIVLRKSSAITAGDLAGLSDGADPSGFGLFKAIINSTSTNSYIDNTGLSANTQYFYAIIPYNRISNDQTYNFLTTTGFPTGSATTLDISATVVPVNVAPVIAGTTLSAGSTLQVLAGFSITSEGTQTLTDIGFNYTGLAGQFTTEYLYRSTTAGTLGTQLLSDNSPDGDFSLTSVSAGNKTINSTPVYYYLVVDVVNTVTSSTATVNVNPTAANIQVSSGIVNSFTLNRTFSFATSQLSDITLTGGTTASINYRNFVLNSITSNAASLSLADYTIREGGGSNDPDDKGMSVTSIQIQVTNAQNIQQIALFDDDADTEIAGTEQTVSGSGTVNITFTPSTPISIVDNGSFDINVRATFRSAVVDKQSIQVSIIAATAATTGSGFSSVGSWTSTQTANNTNIIAVNASKLVFVANPPATPINTNFNLSVKAVDGNPHNNIDLDYIGKVDLTATGGAGTLSGGAQSLSPNLVAGQFAWTQLQITQAGTYTLDASDDAYTGQANNPTDIGDASGSVSISSSPSSITQPAGLNLCFGGNAQTLGNIVITETDPAGISTGGSFSVSLPSGFVFDQSVTTAPILAGGADISAATTLSYPSANVVEFSFTLNGTANTNSITIGGLKIRYPHPGGNSPSPASGSITRSGGTASIAGVGPGTVLGSVNASLGVPDATVGFTVEALSGDVAIDPNTTTFSITSNAVKLVGSPTNGQPQTSFTGSGVTFTSGEYRFNPSSLSSGSYPITYIYQNSAGQGCVFYFTKTFTVYSSGINNFAPSYCNNDPVTLPFTVDQTTLDAVGANYSIPAGQTQVDRYVYFNFDLLQWITITNPANNRFDPKLPEYQPIYNQATTYGYPISFFVGYYICGGIIPCNQASTSFGRYQRADIRSAPQPSFTIPKTTFCSDDLPVTLVGNPANSNNTLTDKFEATGQTGSINSGGTPVVWTFNPQSVVGVPTSFNITYTYKDPTSQCSATSNPILVTVNPRPGNVLSNNIAGGVTKEICQGGSLTSFEATPKTSPDTYNWYSDIGLANMVGTGNSFTPPIPPFDTSIPGTTKFYITQVVSGCESNKQPTTPTQALELSVVVNPTPTQPVPDFDIEYCVGETIDPNDFKILGGTNIRWYKKGTLILSGVSSPSLAQITTAFPTGLGIDNTVAEVHTFEVTQTANGCEGILFPTIINVTIKPLPSLDIFANIPDVQKICTTGGTITFKGLDQGNPTQNGTWSTVGNSFAPGALAPNGTFGTADLNTINLTPNDYVLKYEYTNPLGCSSSTTTNLKVLPKISQLISPLDSCAGTFVRLNNLSTIDNGGLASIATIQNTKWNFSDGSGAEGNGIIAPPYLNNGRTKGTYFSPEHKFNNTGSFTLQYTMTTSDGCNYSGTKQLNIFPKPNVGFTWANVCRDGTTSTQFNAIETSNPALPLDKFYWNFLVNNTLDTTSVQGRTSSSPIAKYNKDGTDSVLLIVTTTAQCRDTIQKIIYVVPKFKRIVTDTSYLQGFDTGPDSWLTGGVNSSWALGTPSGKANGYQFNGDAGTGTGKAWDTNLTGSSNQNEKSWVLSQCYNFSAATKPIISLDIWSDTPQGVEGAVLQYNENGNIEDDANWIVVGEVGSGKNWYDAQGIASSPGNQSSGDIGWTGNEVSTASSGKYSGWKKAIFKLDDLKGKPNVVFRVAFGGGPGRTDGFTFDNVFIGERSRIVLLENFTNSSGSVTVHNAKYKTTGTAAELVKIQYHTAFPGTDPINDLNPQMNNARTAFYGITQSPTMRIDGSYQTGNVLTWIDQAFDDRVLEPAGVRIKISTAKQSSGEVKVNINIENISGVTIPLNGANLFTAIVQQSITNTTLLGNSGNAEFVYVAKEFLPSASGKKITSDLLPGKTYKDSVMWNNLTGDAIIVFVQNIDGNNKNVFQSQINLTPDLPNLVTAIESMLPEQVNIYPNPASREFRIELPIIVSNDVTIYMIDQVGRRHHGGIIRAGSNAASVNVEQLSEGIYILEIRSSDSIIRKKVMVVMKN